MIDAALPYLRCPVCAGTLESTGNALRCTAGHSFDIARQGYVNLTTGGSPHQGDNAAMVAARADFLAAGHYDVITRALTEAARPYTEEQAEAARPYTGSALVIDAGTGTGRHLTGVLDAAPGAVGLGLDVSKAALRRAARAHPRAGAALADLWRPWPVADGSARLVLDVFAPRNGAEFHRVLRPDGALLVVTPAADHLAELVGALGLLRVDPDKADRVAASLGGRFAPAGTRAHRRTLRLDHAAVTTLVGMGPSAWHADPAALAARIAALPAGTEVTVAVQVSVHTPV